MKKLSNKKAYLPLLAIVVIGVVIYQFRLVVLETAWRIRNIENYQLNVQTREEFGVDQKRITICQYILAVKNNEIELADISCEDSLNQKLPYTGDELTISGLHRLARQFQENRSSSSNGYKKLKMSLNWFYGFPRTIDYLIDEDGIYHVIISVENFEVYNK